MPPKWTLYITAQTVCEKLGHPEVCETVAQGLRQKGFDSVVVEGYRGGCVVGEDMLVQARDIFRAAGLETIGGLMPVYGDGFGVRAEGNELRLPTFCYSREETVSALEDVICHAARVFGTVVIDDAFMTACRCSVCDANRRGVAWDVFRRDLLGRVASRWVAAAHAANPSAVVIVKFPQYYDRYHRFGYDAIQFPRIFDRVWQGTETRDPATLDYGFVEQYQAYVNFRWMRACAGDKLEGAWFDYLDCDEQLFYEQAVTTHLGAPSRVIVFCYNEPLISGSMLNRVLDAKPVLNTLCAIAESPVGVNVVKPPHADGGKDLFLFDYLGMLGIPCVPVTHIEHTMRSVIVSGHATRLPNFAEDLRKCLLSGREIIVTFDALAQMDPDLLTFFGYEPDGIARGRTPIEQFELGGTIHRATLPCFVAGDLAPVDASVLIWAKTRGCEAGMVRIPFVTAKTLSTGGRAIVWNVETFGDSAFPIVERLNVPLSASLLHLPKPVCDVLRSIATGPLGFAIKAPVRVAVYLFRRHVVFVNYNAVSAEIEVKGLPWRPESLISDSSTTGCTHDELLLAPRSFALLERATAI